MRTILLSDSLSKEINKVAREFGYTEEKQFIEDMLKEKILEYKRQMFMKGVANIRRKLAIKRLTVLVNNYFPIGPGYLAAAAKNMGHEVSIYEVDAVKKPRSLDFAGEYKRYDDYLRIVNNTNHPIWQEIKDQIKGFHPDLIGISSMTPKIASALVVADICKEVNPDCPVVLGGAHPTVSPDQSIAHNS